MNRRACMGGLAAGSLWPLAAWPHARIGPVRPPVPAPALQVVDHLGQARRLRDCLAGQFTVLQTMFTGCSSVCPIQGALFADLQHRIALQSWRVPVQLLSVSVDPLGDTPQALRRWLQRMQAAPRGWVAVVPGLQDVETLQRSLDGGDSPGPGGADAHRDNVFFFDPQATLRWRSSALPAAQEVMDVLRGLALAAPRP